MTVSRDTIIDLIPLYLSGEASNATQQLVREYLAADPQLADLVKGQEGALSPAFATPPRSPDLEATSFRRARKRLAAQRWAFGLAWLFTAMSLSTEVSIENAHIVSARLALIDAPVLLGIVAMVATICWLVYFDLRRRA